MRSEQNKDQKASFSCWKTNANSLQGKRNELEVLVKLAARNKEDPDVIIITGKKYGPEPIATLAGYQIDRQDLNGKTQVFLHP